MKRSLSSRRSSKKVHKSRSNTIRVILADFSQAPAAGEDDSSEERIQALSEIIFRAGDEPETKSAALLVLMAALENASHPKALANAAKHVAFTRCGELSLYGMVDAQIAMLQGGLFRDNAPLS